MRNKNKKTNVRILATALIGVVVFLLNAGVVGAQTENFSQTCYDKHIKDNPCTNTAILSTCNDTADKKYKDGVSACNDTLLKAKEACASKFFPDECIKPADDEFKKCLEPLKTTLTEEKSKCSSQAQTEKNECNSKVLKEAKDNCTRVDFTSAIKTILDSTTPDSIKKCKEDIFTQEIGRCNEMTVASESKECFEETRLDAEKQCVGVCGNNVVEEDEECDDGNTVKGDGCDEKCKKEGVFRVSEVLKIDEGQSYLEKSGSTTDSTSLKKGLVYLVISFIELLTKIIGSFALLMVIIGGLILMISSGNSQLQQKGKRIILYAILGLVIAFLSLVIVTTIQSLFYTT